MKKFVFLLMVIGNFVLSAQKSEPMITDRPTQSATSAVVPKSRFLAEYGFIYEKINTNLENITFANFLFRYGLIQGLELRVTQNILQSENTSNTNERISGYSPTTVGTKIHLADENGWIPQISIIAQVTLENGEPAFSPDQDVPEIRFNFSNALSEKVSLGYNLGLGVPAKQPYTLYMLVLGYTFTKGWTAFIESYLFLEDNFSEFSINSGLIYTVSNRFQLDISSGVNLSGVFPDYFIGFGAAREF
ncbi:MAG: transporter [Ekhidna sp.]|nr:transporter [Ekhidna sp.]